MIWNAEQRALELWVHTFHIDELRFVEEYDEQPIRQPWPPLFVDADDERRRQMAKLLLWLCLEGHGRRLETVLLIASRSTLPMVQDAYASLGQSAPTVADINDQEWNEIHDRDDNI